MSHHGQAVTSHQPVPLGYPTLPISICPDHGRPNSMVDCARSTVRPNEHASRVTIAPSDPLVPHLSHIPLSYAPLAACSSRMLINSNFYPVQYGYSYPYYVMPISTVQSNSTGLAEQVSNCNYDKLWSGELPSVTDEITHYQLCFILDNVHNIGVIKVDLRDLFEDAIYIQDNFSTDLDCNQFVIFAFMNVSDKEACFMNFAHSVKCDSDMYKFIHPEKQYELMVYLKAFSLPRDMYYQPVRPQVQHHNYKLYVDGINGHFTARDLYKIYNDLYKDQVMVVRIFKDHKGMPYKGAMVQFFSHDGWTRALSDWRVMVKTPNLGLLLRNKQYRQRNALRTNNNSNNSATGSGTGRLEAKRVTQSYGHPGLYPPNRIRTIRNEARNQTGTRHFADVRQVYTLYSRLKHVNYLSD